VGYALKRLEIINHRNIISKMEDLNRWDRDEDSYKLGAKYDMYESSDDDELGYSPEGRLSAGVLDGESESSDEDSYEDPRERINRRITEIKSKKAPIGPPKRVQKENK
jgi:hypothetical protein